MAVKTMPKLTPEELLQNLRDVSASYPPSRPGNRDNTRRHKFHGLLPQRDDGEQGSPPPSQRGASLVTRSKAARDSGAGQGNIWSDAEVGVCVQAYLDMLNLEITGKPYSKAEYNRRVQEATGRTKGSVEFKFQNVSAVLDQLGLRWIQGYKPAKNAQTGSIKDAIERLLGTDKALADRLEIPVPSAPTLSALVHLETVFTDPPPKTEAATTKPKLPPGSNVRKFDRALTDAKNRDLGRAGEEFVVKAEKARLLAAGRKDLADKVYPSGQGRGC